MRKIELLRKLFPKFTWEWTGKGYTTFDTACPFTISIFKSDRWGKDIWESEVVYRDPTSHKGYKIYIGDTNREFRVAARKVYNFFFTLQASSRYWFDKLSIKDRDLIK